MPGRPEKGGMLARFIVAEMQEAVAVPANGASVMVAPAALPLGSKVTTKQTIGSLLPDSEGSLSTAHFEIHQIIEGAVQKMNPSLWLSQ